MNGTLKDLLNQLDVTGQEKTASTAPVVEEEENSLQGIYAAMVGQEQQQKVASPNEPGLQDIYNSLVAEENIPAGAGDLEKIAEQLAVEEIDMVKEAQDLDTMGRFIARGYDYEWEKIADEIGLPVAPGGDASTPALGPKGAVEVARRGPDGAEMDTTGLAHKQHYANTLKSSGTAPVGGIAGPDPVATGEAATGGFGQLTGSELANDGGPTQKVATVRDLFGF